MRDGGWKDIPLELWNKYFVYRTMIQSEFCFQSLKYTSSRPFKLYNRPNLVCVCVYPLLVFSANEGFSSTLKCLSLALSALSLSFLSLPAFQQDSAVQERLPSTQKVQHVEPVGVEEQGQPQRSCKHQEKNAPKMARRQEHAVNTTSSKKQWEPSLKWRNLGLTSPFE